MRTTEAGPRRTRPRQYRTARRRAQAETDARYHPAFKQPAAPEYKLGEMIATRRAYGNGLKKLGDANAHVVALDGDVKNSSYSEIFRRRTRITSSRCSSPGRTWSASRLG
jgi:transketolase